MYKDNYTHLSVNKRANIKQNAPISHLPTTWSPLDKVVTSSPTATTVPATSCPAPTAKFLLALDKIWHKVVDSTLETDKPQAFTCINTPFLPSSGNSTYKQNTVDQYKTKHGINSFQLNMKENQDFQ